MNILIEIGGHTLLRNEDDFRTWCDKNSADTMDGPPEYPCFVRQNIDGAQWSSYEYLTAGDIAGMALWVGVDDDE